MQPLLVDICVDRGSLKTVVPMFSPWSIRIDVSLSTLVVSSEAQHGMIQPSNRNISSMFRKVCTPSAVLAVVMFLSTSAEAGTGVCPVQAANPNQMLTVFSGNYGISGRGVSTSNNTLSIAVGNVTHDGVLTIASGAGSKSGNWMATFSMQVAESSSSGSLNRTLTGIAVINSQTCTGALIVNGVANGTFTAVFVNSGDGVLLASKIPGLFMTYDLGQRE